MHGIFDSIAKNNDDGSIYSVVMVSFLEIYNEKINDLLDPSRTNLHIKEDKLRGIYVNQVTEMQVANAEEMQHVMNTGSSNR